jgi:hypothetical protein
MPIFMGRGVGALTKTLATLAGGDPDQRHLFQVLRIILLSERCEL